jgi:hypothetical protein
MFKSTLRSANWVAFDWLRWGKKKKTIIIRGWRGLLGSRDSTSQKVTFSFLHHRVFVIIFNFYPPRDKTDKPSQLLVYCPQIISPLLSSKWFTKYRLGSLFP